MKQTNEIRENMLKMGNDLNMFKKYVYTVKTWVSSNADLIELPGLVSVHLLSRLSKTTMCIK